MPYLEIISDTRGGQIALEVAPVTMGRCATNAIVLDDSLVGRAHCVVETTPQGHQLRDLASRNGTYRNGERVEAALLRDGDQIQVGATRFRFVLGGSDDG